MTREYIESLILFNKPEVEICSDCKYALFCEIDMFNDHLMYFVREYEDESRIKECGDYRFYTDYEDAITEFLKKTKIKGE